jgi:hypothetical protein
LTIPKSQMSSTIEVGHSISDAKVGCAMPSSILKKKSQRALPRKKMNEGFGHPFVRFYRGDGNGSALKDVVVIVFGEQYEPLSSAPVISGRPSETSRTSAMITREGQKDESDG